MFIENKGNKNYLLKKVAGKKISSPIDNFISEDILIGITWKEVCLLQRTLKYAEFQQQIFNKKVLDDIFFLSLFIQNNIDVNNLIYSLGKERNHQIQDTLFLQGNLFHISLEEHFLRLFIYNSNNIEGSRIPYDEVEKIMGQKRYTYKIKNEIQEVYNSQKAWDFLRRGFTFNITNIKKLYHTLTKNLLQETGIPYPRGFKKILNIVGINGYTTPPEKVLQEMEYLLQDYKNNKNFIPSIQSAFDFHLQYEQIHPFENGNGRTGRLLMNKILMQSGMIPIVIFSDNKKSYSNAINSASDGRKKKYYTFMLEQYKRTLYSSYDYRLGRLDEILEKMYKIKDE